MKFTEDLKGMIEILEIPNTVEVRLIKSKRAPLRSNIIHFRQKENSILEYIIEYRGSLPTDTLKHELCHLKLYLMGLPIFEADSNSSVTSQVLNTLHEDYYVDIILEDRFPESFASMRLKLIDSDYHPEHVHGEVDDSLLSWILQRNILKMAVFDSLGYKDTVEILRGRMEDLKVSLNQDLNRNLDLIYRYLRALPPLDINLREFTKDEIDTISRIVYLIKNVVMPCRA
ncbi:hypothetical protein KEJ51_05350 [Candidatus Bathyarchaeota archaeon]|nr:hypothetical protein [Candidatus Bathyarchaeota archaeon]MBS7629569.1 hypothetical protein [Candidatus Bathyarchaeota archaeon]